MMRIFLKIILSFLFLSFQTVYANTMKVNDITFDSSDSVIFVATSGSEGEVNIKKGILSNPERIFIDIQDAILTKKQSSYDFKNGNLSNLKISQFSANPPVVRIVMTNSPGFDLKNVKVMSIGGNIIIKLQNYKPSQNYLTPIYREVQNSAYDYFEKVRINQVENESLQNDFPIALSPAVPPSVRSNTVVIPTDIKNITPPNEPVRINQPFLNSKLLSRFFVSNAFVKNGSIVISGTGIVNLEKVFYLSNPERVIFDIPNSVSDSKLRNKIFMLSEQETAKIGQFSPTKTRIVITSPDAHKYRAVYSDDLQNLLLAKDDSLKNVKLFSTTSDILSINVKTSQEYKTSIHKLILDFSEPIVHSLKRNNNNIELKLYNVNNSGIEKIFNKINNSDLKNSQINKIGDIGIFISVPIQNDTTIDCLENLNAKRLVLMLKSPNYSTQIQKNTKHNLSKKTIVIDPGHGGSDPGAMRENVQEKNLTLDIAKLVVSNLKEQGASVYITRNDDSFISLSDRVTFSNNLKPDLFVSIHINASENEEVNGIETHYYKDNSIDLAKYIHKSIVSQFDENTNRGVFKSRFYVIKNTTAPAVLLELGFISNIEERGLLMDENRQKKIAEKITEGIINYINNTESK